MQEIHVLEQILYFLTAETKLFFLFFFVHFFSFIAGDSAIILLRELLKENTWAATNLFAFHVG